MSHLTLSRFRLGRRLRLSVQVSQFAFVLMIACTASIEAQDFAARMRAFSRNEVGTEQSAPESAAPETSAPKLLTPRQIYDQTLMATVWIIVDTDQGLIQSTGFICNVDSRFIVTNHHSIEGARSVVLLFPIFENGRLVTDAEPYHAVYREGRAINAIVYDSDFSRDLALLKADELPSEARALSLAPESALPADRIHTIGGNPTGTDGAFVYCSGSVRSVTNGPLATGFVSRKLETDMEINYGNSGGAIVNDYGLVVGVCEGVHNEARGVAMGVDVEELREYGRELDPIITDLNPSNLRVFGLRHFREKRYDVAIHLLDASIEGDPEVAVTYADRGWCYYKLGMNEEAVQDLNVAIEKSPRMAQAYVMRGTVYRKLKEPSVAMRDLNKAISIEPKIAEAYFQRGILLVAEGKVDAGIEEYSRAIELNSQVGDYYVRRAKAYVSQQRHREAIDDLSNVFELDPNNDYAYYLFGYGLYHEQEYEMAVEYFLTAARLRLDYVPYLVWLGDAARHAENHELALDAYDRVLQLEPSNRKAQAGRSQSARKLEG